MGKFRLFQAFTALSLIGGFGLLLIGCSSGHTSDLNSVVTGLVLLPNGQAAVGVAVEVVGLPLPEAGSGGQTVVTGPDGRFSLSGIPAGAQPVVVRASYTHPGGATFASSSAAVTPTVGAVIDVGTLTLASESLDVAYSPQSLSEEGEVSDIADLNGDGAPDLVIYTGYGTGPIAIRLNRGDGSFSDPVVYGTSFTFVQFHQTADFDGDGDLDALIAHTNAPDDAYRLYTNDGQGVFSASPNTPLPGIITYFLVAGDLNGDQAADLVMISAPGTTVRILTSDGAGGFQETSQTTAPANTASLFVEDVDGDNALDLIFVQSTPTNIQVRRNLGGGAFGPLVATPTFTGAFSFNGSAVIADIDGDGDKDVVVDDGGGFSGPAVVRNDAGVFTTVAFAPLEYRPLLTAGDLDGDGAAEIIARHQGNNFAVLGNAGDGLSFQPGTDMTARVAPVGGRVVDFDLDGRNDLLLTTGLPSNSPHSLSLYIQGRNGKLRAQELIAGYSGSRASAAIDVNGDGRADLVATDQLAGAVIVRLAQSDDTFATAATVLQTGAKARAFAAADFDNDGDLDLAVCNESDDTVSILANDGAGAFQKTADLAAGDTPRGIAIADLNNDARLDIAVAVFGDAVVRIYLGDGVGGFAAPTILPGAINQRAVVAADMDEDGDRDLVVVTDGYGDYLETSTGTPTTGGLSVFTNAGNATFAAPTPVTTAIQHPMSVAAADFNGDGKMDLAVAGLNSPSRQLELLKRTVSNGFESTLYPSSVVYTLAVADIDSDGAADVVAANLYFGPAVYRNNRSGGFEYPKLYDGLAGSLSAAVGDVNNDGRPDIVTSNPSFGQLVVLRSR